MVEELFSLLFYNDSGDLSWPYLFNILVNLWELEILLRPLIEYHKRKLFAGHGRDLICTKYVICTIFIQLELCFHSEKTYCRYSNIFQNSVIPGFCWVKQADSPQINMLQKTLIDV